MSDAPDPFSPTRPSQPHPVDTPDPADLGTAFGMELSIEPPNPGAKPDASDDPLSWIRRWIDRQKIG